MLEGIDGMDSAQIREVFVTMSHGQTRFFEAGAGEDVILIHGAGFLSGGHSWLGVMPALAEHFHVYAVDCLGFGAGDVLMQPYSFGYLVDHLREFQDVLGLERSHVVGHSMGGWLAVLLAYESPERVARMVDVAGGGSQARPLASMVRWEPPDEEQIRTGLAASLGSKVIGAYPELVEERTKAAKDSVVTASFRGLMDHMTDPETRLRYNTRRRMPFVSAPTLVLWGATDEVNDLDAARISHELIPRSELLVLDGVGHGVIREAPAQFVDAVASFLSR
jgi:pimeloyl-ACP methyl ester carboxylesterase